MNHLFYLRNDIRQWDTLIEWVPDTIYSDTVNGIQVDVTVQLRLMDYKNMIRLPEPFVL